MSGPFQAFNVDNIIHELVQDICRRQVRAVQPIDRQRLPQQQRPRATKRPRIVGGTEAAGEATGEATEEATEEATATEHSDTGFFFKSVGNRSENLPKTKQNAALSTPT